MTTLKARLDYLYTSHEPGAIWYRYALVLFDAATILFFIATAHLLQGPWLTSVTAGVGVLITLDLAARFYVAEDRAELFWRLYTLADIVVILSLVLDPFLHGNFAFLRILRGLRLIHSYHLMRDLRRDSRFFRLHEDAVIAAVNLFVFVFVTATAVLVLFLDTEASETPYLDALYFTVATLTTTGFGDITLTTPAGKLFSVFVMVVGVALFVRLAQALFHPAKVKYACRSCGLMRHDLDAVHCKHCGNRLRIPTPGMD